jgi:uncharacterized lipoprotein YddW (UPF0748 family)
MDDYFYPYAIKDEKTKKNIPFPDDASWQKYLAGGGKMTRGDWRRENVNTFVARTYRTIKTLKPWVKFGVSPFGIWQPGNPPSIKGGNMYEEISCDSLKWWTNGWVDYLAPQLYWPIKPPDQSFSTLMKWWSDANTKKRNLWPGINTLKVTATNWGTDEIVNQIKIARGTPNSQGHIHWSMEAITDNKGGIADALKPLYETPALIPDYPWLSSSVPAKPELSAKTSRKTRKAEWDAPHEKPFLWVFQQRTGNEWKTEILPGNETSQKISASVNAIAVSSVNRYGAQSPVATVELNAPSKP